MRDEQSTVAKNDEHALETSAHGLGPALKRAMVTTSLTVRARIGAAAQAVADACGASGGEKPLAAAGGGAKNGSFAELPAYRAILKHREIGRVFAISDPFYRTHEKRAGAETWIDGRRYVNFASYDYLVWPSSGRLPVSRQAR
jgi:hypothetical protein